MCYFVFLLPTQLQQLIEEKEETNAKLIDQLEQLKKHDVKIDVSILLFFMTSYNFVCQLFSLSQCLMQNS